MKTLIKNYTTHTRAPERIYDYCKKQGWKSFMWGDGAMLDELFAVAGLQSSNPDPAQKRRAVLNICEKNSKSKKPLFRKARVNLHGQGGIAFARKFYVL